MIIQHDLGFSLEVPDNWHVTTDPTPDIAFIVLAPPESDGFSPNVTVAVGEAREYGKDLFTWHQDTNTELTGMLDDAQLIDINISDDAFRRLYSYTAEGRPVTLEQWMQLTTLNHKLVGVTISATTQSLEYARYLPDMNRIAWSFDANSEGNNEN